MKKLFVLLVVAALSMPAWASYKSTVLADNPLAFWEFEDASTTNGSTAKDSGSRSYKDGLYIANGVADITQVAGIAGAGGKAAYFNGNGPSGGQGNCVDIYDGKALFNASAMSVEAWVKSSDITDYPRLIQHNGAYNDTNCYGIGTYADNGGHITVIGGQNTWYTGTNVVMDDSWHHIVVTYQQVNSGADLFEDVYLDGVHKWGNTVAGKSLICNYTRLTLGSEGNRWYMNNSLTGALDEVAVYDTVLSSGRIADHYAAGIPEPTTIALLGLGFGLLRRKRS
jgi:hypothetical protein